MIKSFYSKIHHLGFYLFCFFPLLPNRIKGLPVVVFFLVSLVLYIKERKTSFPYKKILLFSSLFLIYLITLLYTENLSNIDKTLSTRFSLLVLPISFGMLSTTERKFNISDLIFFIRFLMIVTTVYSICIVLYLYKLGVYRGEMSLGDAMSYVTNRMWLIGQHPIYASIFICLSILFAIFLLFQKKNKISNLIDYIYLIIMVITLFILARKGVIISLFFSLILILVIFYRKKINFVKISLYFAVIIGLFFLTYNPLNNRFNEMFKLSTYQNIKPSNSTSIRYGIYHCALEKISESPIFGFGLGDVQIELNKCYANKSKILLKKTYNSHNQYLSYFLSTGVIGFFVLIMLLFLEFKNAIKENNIFLMIIVVFFSIIMLFENILERQSGVILFAFYLCLFSFFTFKNNVNNESK